MVKFSSPSSFATPPKEEWVAGSGLTLPLWGLGFSQMTAMSVTLLADGFAICDRSQWSLVRRRISPWGLLRRLFRGIYLLDTVPQLTWWVISVRRWCLGQRAPRRVSRTSVPSPAETGPVVPVSVGDFPSSSHGAYSLCSGPGSGSTLWLLDSLRQPSSL